ncbi:toxin-antitoxin system HicB family antitoxin [Paenibacillus dendritiformis]|uniref:toxin-antitoxin system HicB family antitoxin n=1 Tax=Paenibacillus dendritiformis TaxID=130049 RepID=UPI003648F810
MEKQKDLNYYLSLPYTFQVKRTEDGYWASVKELDGCHTSGNTWEEAYSELQEVFKTHIKIKLEYGDPIPEPEDEEYSGKFLVRMPKSLHRHLAEKAAAENVSLNQYALYKLSR